MERADPDRFETAARAASLGVWDWDLISNTFIYSPLAKQICGFPPDAALTLEDVRSVTHPEDLPWTSALAKRAIDPLQRATDSYRYRIRRADTGEVRWVLAHGEAVFSDLGGESRAIRYIGTMQDITEHKRAEDALAESEARLRLAIEAGRMAVWELDLDADKITPSPEMNLLCGFAADAAPNLEDFRSRYAPGEAERIDREGAEVRARGESQIQTEFKQIWPDGTEKWLLLRAQLAPATDRIANRVIGVLVDITDRKIAEHRSEVIALEMQHRVKNVLAVVQTIANQSFRNKADLEAVSEAFFGRLNAFALATQGVFRDERSESDMPALVEAIIRPYRDRAADAFSISGQSVRVAGKTATAIALGLNELCTNAIKYGALSRSGGGVKLAWRVEDGLLHLRWQEFGGPPVVPSQQRGFGTRLLEGGLFTADEGKVSLGFESTGVICEMTVRMQAPT
ncbi:MAG: signal transduction histidine kinase [Hyphomicrobiales bacterium]|nr:signal transduction histidine kinase [Hyphomicrobiales bacterium]